MNRNWTKELVFIASALIMNGAALFAEEYDFNKGWLFLQRDTKMPRLTYLDHKDFICNSKGGAAFKADPVCGFKFDDKDFKDVNLPHDWAIEQPMRPEDCMYQAYRRRGWGYYRKHFMAPEEWRGKHVEIQFGGVSTYSTYWINEVVYHHNLGGYNAVTLDITPVLMYGKENLIAVEVDAEMWEGWWYEGAGIYRDVKLIVNDPVHIATEAGLTVVPEALDGTLKTWTVKGEIVIENHTDGEARPEVSYSITGPDGKTGASVPVPDVTVPAFGKISVPVSFNVDSPALWSPETPNVYLFNATVGKNGKETGAKSTQFGFRTFRFDAQKGFFLNGKPYKLHGISTHQDHAGVGTAVPASIEEFRIRKIKEIGLNAFRCSHGPQSENIMNLCDKYGLLVLAETRMFNPGPIWTDQLEWLVRRDRNHPSVIAWIIGNEEPLQGEIRGEGIAMKQKSIVKAIDPTRPVIQCMNGGWFEAASARNAVDVMGFNYNQSQIPKFHEQFPDIPIISSEGSAAFTTRGVYETDNKTHMIASYDTFCPGWGQLQHVDWKTYMSQEYMGGSFIWCAFDYHGESLPYFEFPVNVSYLGIMDLCGFPKLTYFMRKAYLEKDPYLHVEPHWNWTGQEGRELDVFCATNVEEVQFILNGKDLGTHKVDPVTMLTHKIKYEPGTLTAIGKNGGKEVARVTLETTGKPVAMKLIPDRERAMADGSDTVPVTVCAVDDRGRIVPDCNVPVKFEIEGPGASIGVGNGDPTSALSEKGLSRPLFNGYAQILVQTKSGEPGDIRITANSPDLKDGSCSIRAMEAPALKVIEGLGTGENRR